MTVVAESDGVVYLVNDDPSVLRAMSRRLKAVDLKVEAFDSAE